MDSKDAAELIAELNEDRAEQAQNDRFRNFAALMIAFLAAVLAVGGLGGGNATDDLIGYNIHASDTWSFYQAKNIRQNMYRLAAEEIEAELPALSGAERDAAEARLGRYRATAERYESEPDAAAPDDSLRGEGKVQLMAQARAHEEARDRAALQDNNFDLAEVALQLALVLGSVAILALNRLVLVFSAGLGVMGSILTLNGFLLLFPLPL
ncbi:MAG: DUF4337 domain-containing protein [Allosphingosinicella sp.]|uniref:DUF4337 domain-containing protein n=1 Tax=Allosphingosinicella sp. TaxID=2823234 RepID=UPI00393D76C1